jgi:hypothetical protein
MARMCPNCPTKYANDGALCRACANAARGFITTRQREAAALERRYAREAVRYPAQRPDVVPIAGIRKSYTVRDPLTGHVADFEVVNYLILGAKS